MKTTWTPFSLSHVRQMADSWPEYVPRVVSGSFDQKTTISEFFITSCRLSNGSGMPRRQ